ncbi:MAG: citrate synthase [Acutalibacteraceae bacterium]|nr:citrate synthase [Acutalibacteraceae bacterium]
MNIPESVLDTLYARYKENNSIDKTLYEKLNIARGLRNPDGTGVAVGITNICSVRGYIVDDGIKTATEGSLRYRGYSVSDLVNGAVSDDRFGFEEVVYLLIFGTLPDKDTLEQFKDILAQLRELPEFFAEDHMLKTPSKDIMNKMARSVLSLYSYDENAEDTSLENVLRQCLVLIARLPAIMTYAYQIKRRHYDSKSMFFHPNDKTQSIAESILMSLRPDKKFTHEDARMLDTCLMLHADHGGGNNSTFTVRCLTSTGTDTYSAIAGGISSLKGPLHGGASIATVNMIEDFKNAGVTGADEGKVKDYIVKTLTKQVGDKRGVIYGMGHAVYSLSDPREKILKSMVEKNAAAYGVEEDYMLIDAIERLTPEIFAEIKHSDKPLCGNVDLYSGLVYKMLGINKDLFTPIFATSRIAGWSAHRMEELSSYSRIMRPAYRDNKHKVQYVPLSQRKEKNK